MTRTIAWDPHADRSVGNPTVTVDMDRTAWEGYGARFAVSDDGDGGHPYLATGLLRVSGEEVAVGVLDYGESETFLLFEAPVEQDPQRLTAVLETLDSAGLVSNAAVIDRASLAATTVPDSRRQDQRRHRTVSSAGEMRIHENKSWAGRTAVAPDGEKIGKVDHLYLDRQTGEPTFAAVKTGLFGSSDSLVPVEGASLTGDDVRVGYDKAKIKDAPNVEADGELSEAEEAKLYEYYGIAGYSQYEGPDHETFADDDRDRGGNEHGTVGHDTSGPTTDDAMTRSEEELRVGKTSREVGKARLRKYIVTEDVSRTVPVEREEVRIEREPITDANRGDAYDGPALSEEEHEVTLRAETPVVEKDVVAKERVRLDKDTVTEQVQVDDSVREEQIGTDRNSGHRR